MYTDSRIATSLPYFISELLYVPKSELVNCTTVPLHVITVGPMVPLKEGRGATIPEATTGTATSLTGQTSRGDDSQHCPRQKVGQSVHSRSHLLLPLAFPPLTNSYTQYSGCSLLQCEDLPPAMKKPKISDPTSGRRVAALTDCAARDCTGRNTTSDVETSSTAVSNPASHSVLQERAVRQLSTVIESVDAWILDIDLDFFSTGNPFSSAFTEVSYHLFFVRWPD